MKICILEICPDTPSENHESLFNDPRVDYFYVTYKKDNNKAIVFNKKKSWAYNRNSLFEHVRGKYDYYCFIDYDIILECKESSDPIGHIISELQRLKPGMYRPSGFSSEHQLKSGYSVGGFINHSVTILANQLAEELFNIPTSYGGFWDAASYINTVLVPAYENTTYVDFNIIAHNTQNSGYMQNKVPFIGVRAMNKLYLLTKKYFTDKVPDIDNVTDFRTYYDERRKAYPDGIEKNEVDYTKININDFIDLEGLKNKLKLK